MDKIIKEETKKLANMYLRGLITFEWLVNYICDEMTHDYLKSNNDINSLWNK